MHRLNLRWLVLVLIILVPTQTALAQPGESRIALVVGNAAYAHADALRNPVNDARAMAGALRQTGFTVILKENATRREMTEALREFASKVTPGGVGLFYYAGHGVQVRGANYLLPIDAVLAEEDELKYEAIDVNDILGRLDEARVRLSLVILDACRDNPFPRRFRSASRGLAQLDAPRGTVIAYATAPGETAADGEGANGLYTEELLKAIVTPSLTIEDVFKRAIDGVAQRSANKQTPWVSSSFRGEFYFISPVTIVMPPVSSGTGQAQAPLSAQAIEHAAWGAIVNSTNPASFELFLKRFPDGIYSDFARQRRDDLRKQEQGAQQAVTDDEKRMAERAEQDLALNDAQRLRVKSALSVKGFDTGSPGPALNARARQMIANYQRSRNEPATGFLNAAQYAALIKETQDALAKQEEERRRAELERQRIAAATSTSTSAARTIAPTPAPQTAVAGVPAGSRFDGAWIGTIRCQGGAAGAQGYTIPMSGRVVDGTFRMVKGIAGTPNYLVVEGRIAPDGSATLQASGLTGDSMYAGAGVVPGTPYGYVVKARFDGAHGTGERLGPRNCDFTFSRQ